MPVRFEDLNRETSRDEIRERHEKVKEIVHAIDYLSKSKGFTRDMETTKMNRILDLAIEALNEKLEREKQPEQP